MKWFLALLVLIAGGLATAAFVVPTNAAVVNGDAISQQTLNSDVTAIAASPDYQCYLNSQAAIAQNVQLPPVTGAGKGQGGQTASATTGFTSYYLKVEVDNQLIQQEADRRGLTPSQVQLTDARQAYEQQITSVMQTAAQSTNSARYTCGATQPLTGAEILKTMPSSFVDAQVHSIASGYAVQEDVAGLGPSQADLERYFAAHKSDFDTVCWTAALYQNQSDANAALQLAQTTPFADVAKQAVQGGAQPCATEPQIELGLGLPSSFKLAELPVGTVSFPEALNSGGYLLMQVTSRTPTTFERAKSIVPEVALQRGATKAQTVFKAAQRHAEVTVDPRYGVWVSAAAQVLTPFVPEPSDVPNAHANAATPFLGPASG